MKFQYFKAEFMLEEHSAFGSPTLSSKGVFVACCFVNKPTFSVKQNFKNVYIAREKKRVRDCTEQILSWVVTIAECYTNKQEHY